MAGLKDIRNRITSVKSTRQITSAMKMVSAAKLKKVQDRLLQIKPYSTKLNEVLVEVCAASKENIVNIYSETRSPEKVLVVLMTSNRGLCGAFNANICKKAVQHAHDNYQMQIEKHNLKFLCIGKKANDFIRKAKLDINNTNFEILENLNFQNSSDIVNNLMQLYKDKTFDKIDIVYNSFKNAAVHHQTIEQFLPVNLKVENTNKSIEYIYEPDVQEIISNIVPKSLKIQFYKILLDSSTAEHGARMTAMHQATDNASELIKELTLVYNKARQTAITNEILEITSGAEALKN